MEPAIYTNDAEYVASNYNLRAELLEADDSPDAVNESKELIRESAAVFLMVYPEADPYKLGRLHEFAAMQDRTPVIVHDARNADRSSWLAENTRFVSRDMASCIEVLNEITKQQEAAETLGIDHHTAIPDGGDD